MEAYHHTFCGYYSSISAKQYEENKDKGYTMNDLYGQNGIEYVFEQYLKGKNGIKQIDMSVDGSTVGEYIEKEAIAGSDVVLTIDANIQAAAEKALEEAIVNGEPDKDTKLKPSAGAIVAMNVRTGEVLAMASYPDFEPSSWNGGRIEKSVWDKYNSEENGSPLVNRAVSSAFAPVTNFKMITAITALQTGNVTTTEKINDTGVYPRGHNPVCWIYTSRHIGHGYLNITQAIQRSCNYFFYEMGYRIGIETLNRYVNLFGLGSKTGIELTGETTGKIASRESTAQKGETWTVGYTLSAAIGQGDNNFSPIQMAKYISILVNGGKQINPTLIRAVVNPDGSIEERSNIETSVNERIGRNIEAKEDIEIDPKNLEVVLEGMRGVTSESAGTAYGVFKNFSIEVGGKTGSAQTERSTNAWFVGFAPYDNPEIAIACIIEDGGSGAIACYPARDVIARYFGTQEATIQENLTAIPNTERQN